MIGRTFLVGCPRSGTTLLQSMLGSHPEVLTFPETHYFRHAPGQRWRRLLGLAAPEAGRLLTEIGQRLGVEGPIPRPPRIPRLAHHVDAFCQLLDTAAERRGKRLWVEKTPRHLHRLDIIGKLVKGARFIHIVRDGRDVVASLYRVSAEHPEIWGERSLESCVRRWNWDLEITRSWQHHPDHTVVCFEELLEIPRETLGSLCEFLRLDFRTEMLEHWKRTSWADDRYQSHPWIEKAFEPLEDTRRRKFRELDAPERRQVEAGLLAGGDPLAALSASTPGQRP